LGTVPQRSVRIAGQQRPRKRLSTLHRGDFCPRDRSSGQRRRPPQSADPDGFPPFTNATSSQHEWQTPVVGPDGDPRPPECVRERLPPARRRHIPPRANKRPGNAPSSGAGWMGIYAGLKWRQGLFSFVVSAMATRRRCREETSGLRHVISGRPALGKSLHLFKVVHGCNVN
jgi:hypothetical protein